MRVAPLASGFKAVFVAASVAAASFVTPPAASFAGPAATSAAASFVAPSTSFFPRAEVGALGNIESAQLQTGFLPASHPEGEELSVRINDLQPRVLTNQDKLVVEGTVFVRETTPVLNLVVRFGTSTPLNAQQLQAYLKQQSFAGQWVAHTQLKDVPALQLTKFRIEIPTEALPLGDQWQWGPRGIEVAAETAYAKATDRSLVIWDSQVKVAPSRIHAVAPVPVAPEFTEHKLGSAQPTVEQWQDALAAAQIPGVSLAVPTDILVSEFGQTSFANAQAELLAVPAGTVDVVAISKQPGSSEFVKYLQNQVASADYGNLRVRTDVVVPLQPQPDSLLEQTLLPQGPALLDAQVLRQWAGHTVISGELGLEAPWQYNYSPSTYAFYGADGALAASPADGGLLLTSQQALDQVFNRPASSADELLDDTQFLRGVAATLTRERPFEPRAYLTLLPAHGWSSAQVVRLRALLENRWVATQPTFYTSEGADVPVPLRSAVTEPAFATVPVQAADLVSLETALANALPMAKAIGQDQQVRAEYLLSKQFLFAAEAAKDRQLQTAVVENFAARMQAFANLIRVAEPSTINLVDKNANIPLRLINASGSTAEVQVKLQPSDPRLRIEEVVPVKIRGNSQQAVEFPVKAIGSGDVQVQVIVTSADGAIINSGTSFMVRVRADWESNVTVVMMSLVLVAFIYGLFRTLRRNRRQAAAAAELAELDAGVAELDAGVTELNEAADE